MSEENENKTPKAASKMSILPTHLKRIEEEDDVSSQDRQNLSPENPFNKPPEEGKIEAQNSQFKVKRHFGSFNSNGEFADVFKRSHTMISRKKVSFYNGKPKTEDAIDKIIDPFYSCDKTVVQTEEIKQTRGRSKTF
jgi:hypothetical protein